LSRDHQGGASRERQRPEGPAVDFLRRFNSGR
jgi:hypothetical protein